MTHSIVVVSDAEGVRVTQTGGQVPHGEYQLSGHRPDGGASPIRTESLTVVEDRRLVVQLAGSFPMPPAVEPPQPDEAPAQASAEGPGAG